MIRAFGLFALFHFLFLNSYSQEATVELNQPYSAEFGDIRIGLAPVLLGNTPNGMQFGGSIYLRVYLNKYVSFDTDLCLSRDYMHLGPGIFGIPIAMLFMNSLSGPEDEDEGVELSGEGIVTFLMRVTMVLLSVEHMSAHLPVYQDLEISPYVSFLRYRIQNAHSGEMPENRIPGQFCFAAGLSIDKSFGRFVLSPFIEYNIGYRDKISGYMAGLECSMRFSLTRQLSFR